ncbi:hypothetical protein PspLS_07408 [Pyricularia sp. CBS 133598]|nr:hypothetical protein PspLS_07408 [Pyricularia sp. CBS 133598]
MVDINSRSNLSLVQSPEETRPLLPRRVVAHETDSEPLFSCVTNMHQDLPVYTNIHRIRRDIVSIVEDYLSIEQLRDVRINVSVVRPLVDKLYELDDISIVYCLLVNRVQFLYEQSHLNNRQNVNFARATLCELVATRILRRFNEDNPGTEGLLVLAHILIAGFHPFQNAPEEIWRSEHLTHDRMHYRTLPALEVAIVGESKIFLSSTSCQKVIDAIYTGRIIYTPSSFLNIIPDRYKQKPISLYDPRTAPLLNQYRLIVPRTRNVLELIQFIILLSLYLAFMAERDASRVSGIEICFAVYGFGWVLDNFATILEHGWQVYTQNLWSFLDVIFSAIYWGYLIVRLYGLHMGLQNPGQQALDVLAMGAPVLIPRIAFNLLSDNLLFVSLRAMMSDFTLLTAIAAWCFGGFLLSLLWLGEGQHNSITIGKWMLWIWFGLDGTGISKSVEFHWLLGPTLMIAFTFLGNTLFLTILVSMLSHTFSTIVQNATAEIQYRHAVLTLEGVKADAIFAYQPPFNILALLVLVPLKFLVSPRWFHKIHVASVRTLNLPLLLIIALAERLYLWPNEDLSGSDSQRPSSVGTGMNRSSEFSGRQWEWPWESWHITAHGDIQDVFEVPPPDSVLEDIAVDDDMTRHLIRRQFTRSVSHTNGAAGQNLAPRTPSAEGSSRQPGEGNRRRSPKPSGRRDSITPFPSLVQQLRGAISESDEMTEITSRLDSLEESIGRIEGMLTKLTGGATDSDSDTAVPAASRRR